ncbi:MAG: CoA transferase [Chloroflexi bacterium]|nr:CoA transferase [Chloroflexota bacterium]
MNNGDGPLATPLEGIRMLDLGRYQAGPRCALMFARMGAEVIKVESLSGDESRGNGPRVRGQSAYWVQYNSGKKSLAINLRTDQGKEVLRDLVKVSDILLQNFRPGTIEKMGFGYDVLHELNQRIVMINVSAYGQYGPYKDRVGFDQIGQALGGLMTLTGFPDDPPIKTYFPLIDRITSLHATIGALAALREREISGEGQAIDVSLADTGFTVNEIPISAYLGEGTVEQREGNGSGLGNAYPTSDGWVYITAASDAMWPRVCEALRKPEWTADPRFVNRVQRGEHVDILESELANLFIGMTTKESVDYLSGFSIPSAPVNTTEQAAVDPHVHEREIMVEIPDAVAGTIHVTGKMIKFSRTPMVVGQTPTVGQHTREILSDLLGYTEERIEALHAANVVRYDESPTEED